MTGLGQSRICERGGDVDRQRVAPADRAADPRPRPPRSGRSRTRTRGRPPRSTMTRTPVVGARRLDRRDERVDELARQGVELGRPVQGQADAPRRGARSRTGGRQPSGVSSSDDQGVDGDRAVGPGDDRVEVHLERCRAARRRAGRGATSIAATAARSTGGPPADAASRRAPRSSSSIASAATGVDRREAGSRRRRGPRSRIPPRPTRRPARTAGRAAGRRSAPRPARPSARRAGRGRSRPAPAPELEELVGRRADRVRRRASPRRDAARPRSCGRARPRRA